MDVCKETLIHIDRSLSVPVLVLGYFQMRLKTIDEKCDLCDHRIEYLV